MAQKRRLAVLGHRGSRGTHPENTLQSFEEAVDAKADGIEFDVQFSGDGHCILHHDPKIGGRHCLLNGKKPARSLPISELSLEQIKQYDCGRVFQPLFPRQKLQTKTATPVLTLGEFFEWAKKKARALEWVVELKMPPAGQRTLPDREAFVKTACGLVRQYGVKKQVVFQSFDHGLLEICKERMPEVTRSHLFDKERNFPELARALGASRVSPNFRLLTEKTVGRCRELGLVVTPYTVNRPEDWRLARHFDLDAIITDYPRKLLAFLRKAQKPHSMSGRSKKVRQA